jgi:uncharacterized membrane protein
MNAGGISRTGIAIAATPMIGLGVLGVTFGDFALVWQPIPQWVPAREALAYVCGAAALAGGLGLLWRRTRSSASFLVFAYLFAWLLLLRVPAVVASPLNSGAWLGCGENTAMLAGALVLVAARGVRGPRRTGESGRAIYAARVLLGLALLACGQGHFYYLKETAALVPQWLPAHTGWAAVTGAGFLAAATGILFSVYARLAAAAVTGMVAAFTVLVWLPGALVAPRDRYHWTGLFVSLTITAGTWLVAETYRGAAWLTAQPHSAEPTLASRRQTSPATSGSSASQHAHDTRAELCAVAVLERSEQPVLLGR